MSEFVGKTVIVTGANSGIGEGIAIAFASKGSNVVLTGRDSTRLQNVTEKCRQTAVDAGHAQSRFLSVVGDITEASTRERLIAETVEIFGKIDVLVPNHGVVMEGDTLENMTEETFDKTMNINLKSVLFLIKSAVPHLEKTKGCVVCISSLASRVAFKANMLSYAISKIGLDHMVRCLTLELGPKGIRINCVNPTYVGTRIFRTSQEGASQMAFDIFSKATPLKEQFDKLNLQDHTDVVLFLASDSSRLISGESIATDGGVLCMGNPLNFPASNSNNAELF